MKQKQAWNVLLPKRVKREKKPKQNNNLAAEN